MSEGNAGYFRDNFDSQIVGIPEATWISPDDFTAAYTTARTITLGGGPPAITDNSQLIYIVVIPLVGPARTYIQGIAGVKLTHTAGVITITNVVDPFVVGDVYRVGIGPKGSVVIHGDINVDNVSVDTSGLIGKPAGSDGDFETIWTSATEITCSNFPSWYLGLTADDIETIRQIDNTGAVVKTYSRDDMPMAVAANVITVTGAAFANTDTFVIFTTVDETNYRLKSLGEIGDASSPTGSMTAQLRYLAENIGSLHEMIQACNDSTEFIVYGNSANLANNADHITGSASVLWDKTSGTNVSSGVEDTIASMDLSAYSPNDYVMIAVNIPDLTDVASVGLLLGTDNGNYNRWEWADTVLTAGDWCILIAPISEGEIVALGWDQGAVTWLAFEVIFDNAADTLNTMMIDQISIISAESIGVAMESGIIDQRTQRMTMATDDTVATDLTAILAALEAGVAIPNVTHQSPGDFSATYTSSTTFTLAGLPFTISINPQIAFVLQTLADNTSKLWIHGINCTFTEAGGVVAIHGAGTPFVVGDQYVVGIRDQEKGFDATQQYWKTGEQSPAKDWWTDFEDYTTFAPGTVAYAEGGVISTGGYTDINFAWSKTASDADNSYLKIIYLDTSGGVIDYQEISIGSPVGGVTQIVSNIYEVDKAAGVNTIQIPTKGFPYMKICISKATDTGTDATFTCKINKRWA